MLSKLIINKLKLKPRLVKKLINECPDTTRLEIARTEGMVNDSRTVRRMAAPVTASQLK